MSGTPNAPSCGVCGSKLVKNGTTSAGRRRWRCRTCGASTTRSRPDITRKAELDAFLAWLLGQRRPAELATSTRTFHRSTAWCWNITVPPPNPGTTPAPLLMLDGTYFQSWCLLIAFDGTHVVDWQWCDREKKIAWQQILNRQPAANVVVIDGGRGLETALADTWPNTRVQRCYFHIFQTVRRHHTLNPRLDAGREILTLTRALMNVRDPEQAIMWLQAYNDWEQRWDRFLRHRTYLRAHSVRPKGVAETSTWWYTHRDLRKTRGLFRRLIRSEHLFTWIDPRVTSTGQPLARTTSPLEGGPNKALKDLFRAHRGMPAEHARRAAEWLLNSLTTQPRTPADLARPEHWNPPPQRPAHTPIKDEQVGPAFGTSFAWEDGNGIQHGWAGRHR